jgi:large subunit ribosomal protein LP0
MPVWNRAKKEDYFERVEELLGSYTKVFVVGVDNVGSKQMQQIRQALRGTATVLMGKNTRIRKVMNIFLKKNPGHPIEQLVNYVGGNVGFVFTNGDLGSVRETLEENRVPAPARVGSLAPCNVIVPPGPTGCDPGQTSFFQALQIATKITKGQIEITTAVQILKEGDKVGNSEAILLQKLNILPFTYGLVIQTIYDNGSLFDPKVLDLTDADLAAKFAVAVRNVAAISLQLGYPTLASLPHSIANAFKACVAVAVGLEEFSFEKAEPFKAYLKDPSAFAAASGGGGGGAAPAAAQEEAKPAKEEEEEADIGAGNMFGVGGGGGAKGGGGSSHSERKDSRVHELTCNRVTATKPPASPLGHSDQGPPLVPCQPCRWTASARASCLHRRAGVRRERQTLREDKRGGRRREWGLRYAFWFVVRKVFDVPGRAEIEQGLQALCRVWGGERGAKRCVGSWMKGDGSLGRPTLSSIPVVACLNKGWTREPRISGAGRARWAGICYFLLLLGIRSTIIYLHYRPPLRYTFPRAPSEWPSALLFLIHFLTPACNAVQGTHPQCPCHEYAQSRLDHRHPYVCELVDHGGIV